MTPPADPGGVEVVTKVTVPVLPVVVSVSVNDALLASVVEFVNGAVWVIVVGGGGVKIEPLTATCSPTPLSELPALLVSPE